MLKFGIMTLSLVMLSSSWVFLAFFSMLMTLFWLLSQMSYSLGSISWVLTDDYSNILILLSFWITTLMILSSYYIKWEHKMTSLFSMMVVLMTFFLVMSFSTSNLFMFYIMFEASLIPIFLMVLGWGYQPERIKASFYLLFYTLTASLPLLIGMISIYDSLCTLDLMTLYGESSEFCLYLSVPALLCLMMAFLVKMPVYFFHLWLPKAHVEAPVAGSMMLAGVLLKLGGYGLIRIFMLTENTMVEFLGWFLTLSMFGALIGSLICLRQTDVKSLVAYSSVAHMALVLFGLVSNSYVGLSGAVIIMVSHGLCSSGLFSLVGMAYERVSSRSMLVLRGGLTMTPLMSMWWFLFSVANMAAPPSPNLIGEIMIFISSLSVSGLLTLSIGLASFLGAAFNLYMYSSTQHGNLVTGLSGMMETLYREHQILFFHFSPLILSLFLMMNMFM